MTIDEISGTLPNGFHDAYLCSINVDYVKPEATFALDIWTRDLSSKGAKAGEAYRQGTLTLHGLLYCVIEPPRHSFSADYVPHEDHDPDTDRPWVTGDSSDFSELKTAPELPDPLPDGAFRHWFFCSDTNSFIYVAAMGASFAWRE